MIVTLPAAWASVARDPDTHEPCEPYFTWRYRLYSQDQSADAPSGGDVLDYVATG